MPQDVSQQGSQQGATQGDAQQASFESQFADLAFTYLKDKSPKLLDFARGFQVLDKNEDESRAAGAFGFKVGNQWYISPVFFMNGELKGHELLYIQDQDAFVPLQENWVNYLLNRRPPILGESGNNQQVMSGMIRPDISVFSRSPLSFGKSGEAYYVRGEAFDIRPFVRAFQKSAEDIKFLEAAGRMDLKSVLGVLGVPAAATLFKTAKMEPKFAQALFGHYDVKELIKAAEEAKVEVKDPAHPEAANEGSVEVIRGDDGALSLSTLSDEDREKLVRDGIVIKDNRTGTSKVYNLDIPKSFTSPNESGLYEVMVKPDKFERMLVLTGLHTIGKGATNAIGLVRVDAGKQVVLTRPRSIVTRKQLEPAVFKKFVADLPAADSASEKETYMLVTEGGASVPFTVMRKETENGIVTLWAYVEHCTRDFGDAFSGRDVFNAPCCSPCSVGDSTYPTLNHENESVDLREKRPEDRVWDAPSGDSRGDYRLGQVRRVVLSDKFNGFRTIGNTLMAGKDIRLLKVDADRNFNVVLGTLYDVQFSLFKNAQLEQLDLFSNGNSFEFQHKSEPDGKILNKSAALIHLVKDYGVQVGEAEVMLTKTAASGRQQYLVKRAYGHANGVGDSVMAPAMGILDNTQTYDASVGAPVQYNQGMAQRVQPLMYTDRTPYNPDTRLDNPTLQAAESAEGTGRKDVFDTTVLAGLIKTMNTADVSDRMVGDVMLGLDRIGRLLFMYYWHNDKFQDRYGKQEMNELEDALRNTFKGVGDLVLFLKKKSIEPDLSVRGTDVDLKQIS